jgi:hypothetical protein
MAYFPRNLLCLCIVLATVLLQSSDAFAPPLSPMTTTIHQSSSSRSTLLYPKSSALFVVDPFSSIQLSAGTLDPTTIISDILRGLILSPAILLVPIGAALAVATLLAWLIVSYASPVVEDDEM